MIKIGSIEQVEAQEIPIVISPKCEGRYRWIGVKTLFFEPTFRFNMATTYTVKIPSGTKCQSGAALEKEVSWSFTTPTVKVTDSLPYSQQKTFENPVFFLHFDQKIDPKEVLKTLSLLTGNRKVGSFELLTNEEAIQISLSQKESLRQNVQYKIQNAVEGRYLFFKCTETLPLEMNFNLIVGPKTPSSEGPNVSETQHTIGFSTFGTMKYTNHYPTASIVPCQSWTVTFSNSIEISGLDPEETFTISPKLPGVRFDVSGSNVYISGRSKGQTTYEVSVKNNLKDIYGQHLSKSVLVKFTVGSAAPSLKLFNQGLVTIDPTEDREPDISIISCNLKEIRCCVFQVKPMDYEKSPFGTRPDYRPSYNEVPILEKYCSFGKKVFDKVLKVDFQQDDAVETMFKLKEYLQFPDESLGQLMVLIEPIKSEWKGDWKYRPILKTWIQSTQIAIDAFANISSTELCCWANSLKDGSTMEGVTFQLSGKFYLTNSTGIAQMPLSTNTLIASYKNDTSFICNLPAGKI
jgi:alpha-2-macroglobulin